MPALGASLFLLAIGLILALAVSATVSGVNIMAVGWILAAVGAFGVLMSLLFLMSLFPFGARERHVHHDDYAG